VGVDSGLGGFAGAALLRNTRSLAADDRLLRVEAVLTGPIKPAVVTYKYEEQVECAAAATGGLAQKFPYSTLVDRTIQFGSHGTTLLSTVGTLSMGWLRRFGLGRFATAKGQSEVFQS
jgi:hypothetical protein